MQSQPAAVEHVLEAWLARDADRMDPRFPASLERIYQAETAAARLRALRLAILSGATIGTIALPMLFALLPDAHGAVRFYWLGMAIPIAIASAVMLWTRLPLAWQEAQVTAACTLVVLCLAAILCGSRYGGPSFLLGGVVLMLMLGLIAARLSFGFGALLTAALLGVFTMFIRRLPGVDMPGVDMPGVDMPGVDMPGGWMLVTLLGGIGLFALFGNWRLETETRRGYALMLRARLGQPDRGRQNGEPGEPAQRDALTGLANRRAYDAWLAASWQRGEASRSPVGLVIIDVDQFEHYNDFYGHSAGDVCLLTVAACLRDQLRGTTDLVARIGGEEFAVILPDLTLATCGDVAERLRSAVANLELPHFGVGSASLVSISLGAASFVPSAGHTPRALAAAADRALHAAKQAGRDCVFLAGMDAVVHPARQVGVAG